MSDDHSSRSRCRRPQLAPADRDAHQAHHIHHATAQSYSAQPDGRPIKCQPLASWPPGEPANAQSTGRREQSDEQRATFQRRRRVELVPAVASSKMSRVLLDHVLGRGRHRLGEQIAQRTTQPRSVNWSTLGMCPIRINSSLIGGDDGDQFASREEGLLRARATLSSVDMAARVR